MTADSPIECDLTVIGTGISGLAAAAFAAGRELSTVLVGGSGEIIFASGLLDLLAVHPLERGQLWQNPWRGIDALVRDNPAHPYGRLTTRDIRRALEEFLLFLHDAQLPYCRRPEANVDLITSAGTVKRTYGVPHSMWNGIRALKEKQRTLIVDIEKFKGFSARQIAAMLADRWPQLRSARIAFPDAATRGDLYAEHMASSLSLAPNRRHLAAAIEPHLKDTEVVALPAILGLYQTHEIISDLERLLGLPVFEIPTMPPSVPGLRLKEAFERGLRAQGVVYLSNQQVLRAEPLPSGGFELAVESAVDRKRVTSRGVILATGRFLGGGLKADRKRIRETLFDLPVSQPGDRRLWHRTDLLDPRGHLINQAGIEIDDRFRPLAEGGLPAAETLFAAGSILAHQDWMRAKCGSGLAIATAYGAVQAFLASHG